MKNLKSYWLTILWIIIMCYLLFSPSSGLPKGGRISIPHFDKIVHLGMFAILAVVLLFETDKQQISFSRVVWILLLFAIPFAVISEVIQHYLIDGRNGSSLDFSADALGIAIGMVFYKLVISRLIREGIKT